MKQAIMGVLFSKTDYFLKTRVQVSLDYMGLKHSQNPLK